MYYLDGRWRRQALVYFGEPQDSSANVAAGRCVPGGAHSLWHDVAAMAWSSTPSSRRRTKDYLPATQPEESITPQSSRRPNELFASELV